MRIVAGESEILETKVVYALDGRVQLHPRQRSRLARELFVCLVEMVSIKMEIAKGVDEFPTC